jgi:ribosome maturation factor RimP
MVRQAAMSDQFEEQIGRLVDEAGFELVALERGGARKRPLLRLRIDRPGGEPGRSGVTAADCAEVSRLLHERLVAGPHSLERFVLEVSSPGVERPLVRPGDFDRFAGQAVSVRGYRPLVGDSRQVEGILIGRVGSEKERIALQVEGDRVEIPLDVVSKATLAYRWQDDL